MATLHCTKWLGGRIYHERIKNSTLCHRVTEYGFKFDVRKPIQKHNYKATGDSRKKSIKDSRDFVTAELISNQVEIKKYIKCDAIQTGCPNY